MAKAKVKKEKGSKGRVAAENELKQAKEKAKD